MHDRINHRLTAILPPRLSGWCGLLLRPRRLLLLVLVLVLLLVVVVLLLVLLDQLHLLCQLQLRLLVDDAALLGSGALFLGGRGNARGGPERDWCGRRSWWLCHL